MISETAFFVKDVIGPAGSVSIFSGMEKDSSDSSDLNIHVAINKIRRHHAELAADGTFSRTDEMIDTTGDPAHDDLCRLEQKWFLEAIHREVEISEHHDGVIESLEIVLAAYESIGTGQVVQLQDGAEAPGTSRGTGIS